MPQINVTLNFQETIERLKEIHGGSNNENGRKSIEGYIAMRTAWEAHACSVRGKIFTRAELSLLCDIQNGTIFDPNLCASQRTWLASLEDADEFDKVGEKWNVDMPGLAKKIKSLSPPEIYFYREEIDRFWQNPVAYGSPAPDLKAFCDKFAK